MWKRTKITEGQRFGRLVVLRVTDDVVMNDYGVVTTRWIECMCDCGKAHRCKTRGLVSGQTRSCGCLRDEVCKTSSLTHGESYSREYRIWWDMRNRCNKTSLAAYKHYGARGIKVCERWDFSWGGFENFIADMGRRPSTRHSLDRIDNNGNYCPENCKWSTWKEQFQNTRRTVKVTHDGRTMCLAEWSREIGISSNALKNRIARGYPEEEIFSKNRRSYSRWDKPGKSIT